MKNISFVFYILFIINLALETSQVEEEDEDPYTTTDPKKREPSPCEICKYFATELKTRLEETGKSKEVIETGHGLEKKKRVPYKTSELRLTEALLEPHICDKILEYNVHAERKGSLRYAKGMSETMQTLHGLVDKGVKVELGMPYELWDKPSAEVTKMHRACFRLAEEYEEEIEHWYYHKQETDDIVTFLCAQRYLKNKDQNCLKEAYVKDKDENKERSKKERKSKMKGDAESNDSTSPAATNKKHGKQSEAQTVEMDNAKQSQNQHTEL